MNGYNHTRRKRRILDVLRSILLIIVVTANTLSGALPAYAADSGQGTNDNDTNDTVYGVLGLTASGDIASGTCGTCSWVIDQNGVLTIKPTDGESGTLARVSSNTQWLEHCEQITSVVFKKGVIANNNSSVLFDGCTNLTSIDFSNFDTSNATSIAGMFRNCNSLESVDLSGFDTSNVTRMGSLFNGCSALTDIKLGSGFVTDNVTVMTSMFQNCNALSDSVLQPILDGFSTSNVTDMDSMFKSCTSLNKLDLSGFDTRNVVTMTEMVGGTRLEELDLSGKFDTTLSGTRSAINITSFFGDDYYDTIQKITLGEKTNLYPYENFWLIFPPRSLEKTGRRERVHLGSGLENDRGGDTGGNLY